MKVKRHIDATLPYSATKEQWSFSPGSNDLVERWPTVTSLGRTYYQKRGNFLLGTLMGRPGIFLPGSDAVPTEAYLAFYKKVAKHLQTSQGLVTLGEIRETLHAIRHPLESLKQGISDYLRAAPVAARKAVSINSIDRDLWDRGVIHVRQGRRRRARQPVSKSQAITQAISGTYLEYANGWAPLVNDIKQTMETLANHRTASGVGYRKVSAKAERSSPNSMTPLNASNNCFIFDRTSGKSQCQVKGEVVVTHDGSVEQLMAAGGFTLKGFVPTIYELIPLSYVADYFWNMGDILSAWSAEGRGVSWACQTIRLEASRELFGYAVPVGDPLLPTPTYVSNSGSPGKAKRTVKSISRVKLAAFSPSVVISLPLFNNFRKLANVSSLLAQSRSSSRQISRLLNG